MLRTYITLTTPYHVCALGTGHPQTADEDGYETVLQFQVLYRINSPQNVKIYIHFET